MVVRLSNTVVFNHELVLVHNHREVQNHWFPALVTTWGLCTSTNRPWTTDVKRLENVLSDKSAAGQEVVRKWRRSESNSKFPFQSSDTLNLLIDY